MLNWGKLQCNKAYYIGCLNSKGEVACAVGEFARAVDGAGELGDSAGELGGEG